MDFAIEPLALSPGLKDFIAGAVAGAFAITVSQPLDTVRVRLQQAAHGSGPARNALSVLSSMVRGEGVLSPFKGLTYPLLFASVQSAILFQAYGWTLRQLASPQEQPQPELSAPRSSLASREPGCSSPTAPVITPAAPAAASAMSPALSASSALHQLHLHHHHRRQEQRAAAVHGPASVSGQLVAWVAARMAATGPGTGVSTASSGPSAARAARCSGSQPAEAEGTASGSDSSSVGRCAACADGSSGSEGREAESGGVEGGQGFCAVQAGGSRHLQRPHLQGQQHLQAHQEQPPATGHQAALPTPWHGFVAGSVAGFAQVFLWSPVELLKLRAQLQTATPGSAGYRNPAALARHVLRQDGVAGLYRGFTLTVIRDIPSFALYFWIYHDIAGALSPGVHPEQAPPTTQVLAGGLAGVLAWLPIYPLDVLKTRVQAVSASASGGKTWMGFAGEMYREAGARAFFRGMAPTLVRAFLMDGASFLGYTTTLKVLGGGASAGAGGREAAVGASVPATA